MKRSNMDGHPAEQVSSVDLREEWAAFDSLPREFRDFLNGADLRSGADGNYNAIQFKEMLYSALMAGKSKEFLLDYCQRVSARLRAEAELSLHEDVMRWLRGDSSQHEPFNMGSAKGSSK